MLISSRDILTDVPRKNVLPAVWTLLSPVKLTITPSTCEYMRNKPSHTKSGKQTCLSQLQHQIKEGKNSLMRVWTMSWSSRGSEVCIDTTWYSPEDLKQRASFKGNSIYSTLCYSLYGKRTLKRVDTCICVTDSLCCVPENNAAL